MRWVFCSRLQMGCVVWCWACDAWNLKLHAMKRRCNEWNESRRENWREWETNSTTATWELPVYFLMNFSGALNNSQSQQRQCSIDARCKQQSNTVWAKWDIERRSQWEGKLHHKWMSLHMWHTKSMNQHDYEQWLKLVYVYVDATVSIGNVDCLASINPYRAERIFDFSVWLAILCCAHHISVNGTCSNATLLSPHTRTHPLVLHMFAVCHFSNDFKCTPSESFSGWFFVFFSMWELFYSSLLKTQNQRHFMNNFEAYWILVGGTFQRANTQTHTHMLWCVCVRIVCNSVCHRLIYLASWCESRLLNNISQMMSISYAHTVLYVRLLSAKCF